MSDASKYNSDATYFMVHIEERYGDHEHSYVVVVEAGCHEQAEYKAQLIASGWHGGDCVKNDEWFTFENDIWIRVESVSETNLIEFFERSLHPAY